MPKKIPAQGWSASGGKQKLIIALSVTLLLAFSLSAQAATKAKLTKAVITQINNFTLTATKNNKTYTINAQRAVLKNAKGKRATIDQIFTGDQIDVNGTMGAEGIIIAKIVKDRSLKGTDLTRRNVGPDNLQEGAISDLSFISNGVITGDKIKNATITGANLATDLSVNTTGQVNASGLCLSGDCKTAWDQVGGTSNGVSSVSNSDGTLTISPTTGATIASLNLGHANSWSAAQTFSTDSYFPGSGIWNASGNVGIGTTNPGHLLHIYRNSSVATAGLTLENDVGSFSFETGESTYKTNVVEMAAYGVDAKNYFRAYGFGGTKSSPTATPSGMEVFAVVSRGYTGVNNRNIGSLVFTAEDTFSGTNYNPGSITMKVGNGSGTETTAVHINSSANVGIGTASPSGRLDIHGVSTGTGINTQWADSTGAAKVSILDNGNVGIGTTNPQSKLQVDGGYIQLDKKSGAPASADCDAAAEEGRMYWDATADNFYICSGASGWRKVTTAAP